MLWKCSSALLLCLAVNAGIFELNYSEYHNYDTMTAFLKNISEAYPNLTHLYSIGESYQDRQLWVMKISGGDDTILRPHVKLLANVNGNESVGRELLLRFIKYLLDEYDKKDQTVRRILDYSHVHILPSMNPDGFENHLKNYNPGTEISEVEGRENSNGVRLDTDFNSSSPQKETLAVKKWMKDIPFVLSATLNGGSISAFYPYVYHPQGKYATVDDDVFNKLALAYAEKHMWMQDPENCVDYGPYESGFVSTGGSYSPIKGSMMDFNYITHGCMEISFQISCHKYPFPDELPDYWDDNKESLLAYLGAVRNGIRGLVIDDEGNPVPNAKIRIAGRESTVFRSTSRGEFWRLLRESPYMLQVYAEGFETKNQLIRVKNPASEDEWPMTVNITLNRPGLRTSTSTSRTVPKVNLTKPTYNPENIEKDDDILGLATTSDVEANSFPDWVLVVCLFVVFVTDV